MRAPSMAEVITAPSGRFGRGGGGPEAAALAVPFEALCPTPPIGSLTARSLPSRSASDPLRRAVLRPFGQGVRPSAIA
jgi:hypothetical protein